MRLYEINIQYPGTLLDLLDADTADEVYLLISEMNSQLEEAALLLSLYQKEKNKFLKTISHKLDYYDKGIHHSTQLLNIYSKSFVYALTGFGNCIVAIASEYALPGNIEQVVRAYKSKLSTLWNIRHSLQHAEDRIRGLGRPNKGKKKKIRLQGSLLVMSGLMLHKDRLSCTVENGAVEEIEINDATLRIAEETLQKLINSLPWRGAPHGYITEKAWQKFMRNLMRKINKPQRNAK